jgi:hypothetical protein
LPRSERKANKSSKEKLRNPYGQQDASSGYFTILLIYGSHWNLMLMMIQFLGAG